MSSNNETQRVRVNRNLWKTSLTKEIIHLEDNLDQIFYTVGLKPHRIVREADSDEALMTEEKGISQSEQRDYEAIIDEQADEVEQSVHNICALISSVTEFDLPVPALVLLKLAARVGSIRCTDFKKKVPGTLAKKYIHNKKSLQLIASSLTLYKWVSNILSSDIIPFLTFVNQNLFNLLSWTRTSNLVDHDKNVYYTIRMQILDILTRMVEHLSVNINFDSTQLATFIEEELLAELEQVLAMGKSLATSSTSLSSTLAKSNANAKAAHREATSQLSDTIETGYACKILHCLDRLFIVYVDFLHAKLELQVKSFIIRTCISIYRDFDQNVIGLACRRQLLHLLETISNRPFATSTTELAWHIFELCDKMESDPEIRYIARRSLKFGLAHRPIIVSHYDVHDCFARKCDIQSSDNNACVESTAVVEAIENGLADDVNASIPESPVEASIESRMPTPVFNSASPIKDVGPVSDQADLITNGHEDKVVAGADTPAREGDKCDSEQTAGCEPMDEDAQVGDKVESAANGLVNGGDKIPTIEDKEHVDKQEDHKVDSVADKHNEKVGKDDVSDDDEQVKPYLDLFVSSLVPKASAVEK